MAVTRRNALGAGGLFGFLVGPAALGLPHRHYGAPEQAGPRQHVDNHHPDLRGQGSPLGRGLQLWHGSHHRSSFCESPGPVNCKMQYAISQRMHCPTNPGYRLQEENTYNIAYGQESKQTRPGLGRRAGDGYHEGGKVGSPRRESRRHALRQPHSDACLHTCVCC